MSRSTKKFVFSFLGFIYFYIRVCFQFVAFVRERIWHKVLLMGYSMRLEITCVCSLNGFQLAKGLHGGHSSLFLRVFTLACFTPHWAWIFDMFFSLCVCVCVCVYWSGFRFHLVIFFSVWVCALRFFCVVWNLLVIIFLLILFWCVCIYVYIYVSDIFKYARVKVFRRKPIRNNG